MFILSLWFRMLSFHLKTYTFSFCNSYNQNKSDNYVQYSTNAERVCCVHLQGRVEQAFIYVLEALALEKWSSPLFLWFNHQITIKHIEVQGCLANGTRPSFIAIGAQFKTIANALLSESCFCLAAASPEDASLHSRPSRRQIYGLMLDYF